ncbi:LemA family protein [Clostridium brassicae]|uniref:LemA family protein n=1 Tax=Clostridium brassicae TaxID=2999072 RepID=A0ABT4DDV5_9CLOT|nr:LemA family protein [Clostridium brassicae]MCY6959391.1 LemA family protein [Clostridium brassicae]
MKKSLKTLLIVLGILILIAFPIIGGYNKMVTLEQTVKRSESNIDTQLQRRNDLIPNLVSTVKGYASQEKEIFTEIANARTKLNGAGSVKEKANADNELTSALSRLLVIVERYPDLKSSTNFKDLTVALEGTENRINLARQDYNKTVDNYNTTIKRFPNSIVASIFRFESKEYYKAAEGAKDVPKVDFTR